MTSHQVRNKKGPRGGPLPKRPPQRSKLDQLALPEEEIRRLVLLTTTRYKIEPFVRQLIRLMDDLRAGHTNNIAKLTRPGKDASRAILFAAIERSIDEGRTMAAYHTAYQATLYAYENSLDHLLAFHDYLDGFRQHKPTMPP